MAAKATALRPVATARLFRLPAVLPAVAALPGPRGMATLPGPATDGQVAVPICTRTVPSMEMHRSVAAEATPAVIATSRTVAANATAPRRLAVRRVRFMLRVSL